MAVDAPIYYKGYWTYLRVLDNPYGTPTTRQTQNAERIYNVLRVFGYSHAAACGILGNMQTESGINPGALQSGKTNILPNDGEHFADLTNQVMLSFADPDSSGYGIGLIQWDGYNDTEQPNGAIIVSFATRYDCQWFDGDLQLFRLEAQYILDPSGWGGINGRTIRYWHLSGTSSASITWANFKTFNGTPEDACDYFRENLERSSSDGVQHRRDNARYWYNYFMNYAVTYKLHNKYMANMAYLFRDSGYTYAQYDCVSFVNRLCRRRLGFTAWDSNGTNSLWRDVAHENPFQWKGTMQECLDRFNGEIPRGAYLFKIYPEGSPGYDTIPDRYRGDGVGNVDHIGVYTDLGKGVMQSGGYDAGVSGVADCYLHPQSGGLAYDWWTHVALDNDLIFSDDYPVPAGNFPKILFFINKRRSVGKNAIKWV